MISPVLLSSNVVASVTHRIVIADKGLISGGLVGLQINIHGTVPAFTSDNRMTDFFMYVGVIPGLLEWKIKA